MNSGKQQFIECSRIANEIRVAKMKESAASPGVKKTSKKVKSIEVPDANKQEAS